MHRINMLICISVLFVVASCASKPSTPKPAPADTSQGPWQSQEEPTSHDFDYYPIYY